jgi:hypothetical protein
MKKNTRRGAADSELTRRGLRLSKHVIRTLTVAQLTQAVGGSCDTGSITTGTKTKTTIIQGG